MTTSICIQRGLFRVYAIWSILWLIFSLIILPKRIVSQERDLSNIPDTQLEAISQLDQPKKKLVDPFDPDAYLATKKHPSFTDRIDAEKAGAPSTGIVRPEPEQPAKSRGFTVLEPEIKTHTRLGLNIEGCLLGLATASAPWAIHYPVKLLLLWLWKLLTWIWRGFFPEGLMITPKARKITLIALSALGLLAIGASIGATFHTKKKSFQGPYPTMAQWQKQRDAMFNR